MKFKKLLSFAAAVAMACTALLGSMTITASAYSTSGNLRYYVDSTNKVLYIWSTVEGGAAMNDFSSYSNAPWYGSRSKFTKVVIGDGVTSVGKYALAQGNYSVTEVVIGSDVTSISDYAFYGNSKLEKVTISNNCTSIGTYAFYGCSSLKTVQTTNADPQVTNDTYGYLEYSEDDFTIGLPSKLTTIKDYAFQSCSAIAPGGENSDQYLSIPSTVTTIGNYAFYGCSKAFNTITLYAVSDWGTYTFYGCTSITKLSTSGTTITKIPNYSFQGCTSLVDITGLNGYITEIGTSAFQGCTALDVTGYFNGQNLRRNQKLTTIGAQAFYGCKGSTSATLNLSLSYLTTIGQSAFRNCTEITTVNFGSALTSMGTYVFAGCTDLTTIENFPTKITEIPDGLLNGCTALESYAIPSQITSVGSYAFSGCTNLSSISFTSYNIKSVGDYAFQNCTALTSLSLPSSVTSIGKYAFSGSGLTSFMVPIYVTSISDYTFKGCTALTSVTFPDDITSFGNNIFDGCTSLTSITLPKNLETVTGRAFVGSAFTAINANSESTALSSDSYGVLYNADKTTLIAYPAGRTSTSFSAIPSTVTTIGAYAFYGNDKLTSVTIGSNVETIEDYAFYSATKLTSQTIPIKVKSIGNYAFTGSAALKTLTFTGYSSTAEASKSNCESIGTQAFKGTALTSVTTPISLKSIGLSAFQSCTALATVTLSYSTSLETIGNYAFDGDSALKTITLPDSVTSLGTYAFQNCTALTSVKLSKGLESIGLYTFSGCTALKTVTIPNGITSIGNYAFNGCTALTEANIPNSVTSLGNCVFYNCSSLEKAVISNQVTTLTTNLFSGCTNENLEIYILGTISSKQSNSFGSAAATYVMGTVYVYDDSSYTSLSSLTVFTNGSYGTLKYGADLTELKALIAEAKALDLQSYTESSVSALESSLALADSAVSNYAVTQGQADSAVTAVKKAISSLVVADTTESIEALTELVKEVEAKVALKLESNYTATSWAALKSALEAANEALESDDVLKGTLLKLYDNLSNAYDELAIKGKSNYISTIYGGYESGYNQATSSYKIIVSDDVDMNSVVGTTYVNVTLTPNPDLKYQISYGKLHIWNFLTSDTSYTSLNGSADNVVKYALSIPSADTAFSLTAGTGWTSTTEVFYVKSVDFYDANDTLLYTYDSSKIIIPSATLDELNEAIATAEEINKDDYTADSLAILDDILAEAKAVANNGANNGVDESTDYPVVISEIEAAVNNLIEDTTVVKESLDELLSEAKAFSESDYTAESYAALQEAIKAADAITSNSSISDIEAAIADLNDAIAGLVKKSSEPSSSEPTSASTTATPTTAKTTAKTAAAKTTRSAAQVKKDKTAAQKVMKQAKIKKLTVKSKAKKKISVSWKKVSGAKGYQVQVSTKKNFKKIIFKKFTSKKKLTIKNSKIKSKKTYYVRVRAYATYKDANGKSVKVYSKWNKKLRKVTVK